MSGATGIVADRAVKGITKSNSRLAFDAGGSGAWRNWEGQLALFWHMHPRRCVIAVYPREHVIPLVCSRAELCPRERAGAQVRLDCIGARPRLWPLEIQPGLVSRERALNAGAAVPKSRYGDNYLCDCPPPPTILDRGNRRRGVAPAD